MKILQIMGHLQIHNFSFAVETLQPSLGGGEIDRKFHDQIVKEENHWKEVLCCVVDTITKQQSPVIRLQNNTIL